MNAIVVASTIDFRCRGCGLEMECNAPTLRPPTLCPTPSCRLINSFVRLPEGHVVKRLPPQQAQQAQQPYTLNSTRVPTRWTPNSPNSSHRQAAEIIDPATRVRVPYVRSPTGISALDYITGGGLARGYVLMLAGPPGCHKSTLCSQACSSLSVLGTHFGCGVVYGSAEEDEEAVIETADRVGVANFKIVICTSMQGLIEAQDATGAVVRVVDSLMTTTSDDLPGEPGSPSQVNACATLLYERSHATGRYKGKEKCSYMVIAHGTKDGDLAGPMKALHAVDGAILMEHVDPFGDIKAGRAPWSVAPDQTRPTGFVSARVFRKMRKASNRRIAYFEVQPEYLDDELTELNPIGGRIDRVEGPNVPSMS